MSPSWDTRSPTDDGPPKDPFAFGRRRETSWGYTSPTEDSPPNDPFGRRREMLNCDDPPSYSSLTIRRSNDIEHPWNGALSTYRRHARASSTAGPFRGSHRQTIRQLREHELRNAVQSSPESRLGSFMPSLPPLPPPPPSQPPLLPGSSRSPLPQLLPRSPRAPLPASTTKPRGAVSMPVQPPSFSMSYAPNGMAANQDGTLDQTEFPELTWPWRWCHVPSNTTNPSANVIAPINQETGEVHGSPYNKLPYTNVNVNTPSPASKDTSRTTLPIRILSDRCKPPVFGEPTALKSTAYEPLIFTTPELPFEARRETLTKARDSAFLNKSTQLEDPPGLRARLDTIRDLRERKYSDIEIDIMVADMDNVELSFPELLEKLRNGSPTDTATKQAERAQSNVGARPTTSTTPTTPAKRDVPTYSCSPSDVEKRRTKLPIRSQITTNVIKSRFAVENLASAQTDTTACAKVVSWSATDKSKAPEEKAPEDEFETLNLDSDEEEWDKIDVDEEWEVVNDPRVGVEKNAV